MDSLHKRDYRLEELMPLIREQLAVGRSVRFNPKGTSMMPMLRQGIDSVVLSPLPGKLKKFDLPLYQRRSGQYVLHRIVKVGECYTCLGDNQFDPEPGLDHNQMIGVVTAFYRDQKRYAVTAPAYWLYCRVWHYSRGLRKLMLRAKALLRRFWK